MSQRQKISHLLCRPSSTLPRFLSSSSAFRREPLPYARTTARSSPSPMAPTTTTLTEEGGPAVASLRAPLSTVIPPLVFGCATFNEQYNPDPTRMPYVSLVARALELGVAAFDTSPYYGPSELLLGDALKTLTSPSNRHPVSRDSYFVITKAGRIGPTEFDYSPAWIRYSVLRSCDRLGTNHLDLVYTHDVEFVTPAEVLGAVKELRRLRDEGLVRYVGISGYPVNLLCDLAEMIQRETGEGVDAVMSYCHGSIQNTILMKGYEDAEASTFPNGTAVTNGATTNGATTKNLPPLTRLHSSGVSVVLNASMLGMGLLTTRGVDQGPQATWHPSPPGLRKACADASAAAIAAGEKIEKVAIRYALDAYARAGGAAGVGVHVNGIKGAVGANVMGVSTEEELQETWRVWQSVLQALPQETKVAAAAAGKTLSGQTTNGDTAGGVDEQREWSLQRREQIRSLVHDTIWPLMGEWRDYSWASPDEGFVNSRKQESMGTVPEDGLVAAYEAKKKSAKLTTAA